MNVETITALNPGIGAVREIDLRLSAAYGRPVWRSHGDPLDQLIGTVLSQHTSDSNTARAFASLRARFGDWRKVMDAPVEDVVDAIRCGGLANIKAPRIQRILEAIERDVGELSLDCLQSMSLEEARAWLTRLPGVGPKTTACVLLFSLGLPTMPVDTHVHRVCGRLGLYDQTLNAEAAHRMLDALIGADRDVTYALHMNLIHHGRGVCRARAPQCGACVLADICPSAGIQ